MDFDFLVGSANEHYTQRNNKFEWEQKGPKGINTIKWVDMCNVTLYCEAAEIIKWVMPKGQYDQNEDNFADFIIRECLKEDNWFKRKFYNEWKRWYDGDPKANAPINYHDCLAYYFNKWIGCDHAVRFEQNCKITDIVNQICFKRKPVLTSVKFGELNHIILLTGTKFSFNKFSFCNPSNEIELEERVNSGNLEGLELFKYSDSYGIFDFETKKYINTTGGWNNIMTFDNFLTHVKDTDSKTRKYAHIFDSSMTLV